MATQRTYHRFKASGQQFEVSECGCAAVFFILLIDSSILCCVVCVTWWIGYCVCVCVVHALYIVCNSFRSQI